MTRTITPREVGIAVGAFVFLLVVGTIGYSLLLDESPFEALFRTVNTIYTAGLVDAPDDTAAKVFTLALVVGGVAVFLYVFALLIELAVSGSMGSALVRRRTARRVNKLEDHYIICGYGRVGRRIGREFRASGLDYVVIDFGDEAVKAARDLGDLVIESSGTDRIADAGRSRHRARARRVERLGRRQPLRDAVGQGGAAGHAHRREGGERGRCREAPPRGCGPRRPAVRDSGPRDGEARGEAAGGGVPRHRHVRRRPRPVDRGDRGDGRLRTGGQVDPRSPGPPRDGSARDRVQKPDGRFDATPSPDTALEVGDVVIAVGTVAELQQLEELFAERD